MDFYIYLTFILWCNSCTAFFWSTSPINNRSQMRDTRRYYYKRIAQLDPNLEMGRRSNRLEKRSPQVLVGNHNKLKKSSSEMADLSILDPKVLENGVEPSSEEKESTFSKRASLPYQWDPFWWQSIPRDLANKHYKRQSRKNSFWKRAFERVLDDDSTNDHNGEEAFWKRFATKVNNEDSEEDSDDSYQPWVPKSHIKHRMYRLLPKRQFHAKGNEFRGKRKRISQADMDEIERSYEPIMFPCQVETAFCLNGGKGPMLNTFTNGAVVCVCLCPVGNSNPQCA